MAEDKFEVPEEVKKYLGFEEEFESEDDFKTAFDSKYVKIDAVPDRQDIIDPLFGKMKGSIETKAKNVWKGLGIELASEDVKGKKIEEILELGASKVSEHFESQKEELKNSFSGKPNEQVTKIQTAFDEYKESQEKKYKETEELLGEVRTERDTLIETHGKEIKSVKLSQARKSAFDKVEWATDSEGFKLKKKGFEAAFNEKYNLDFDEDGKNLIITDKKGEKIKSTRKAGEFEDVGFILESEAKEHNLLKINKNGGAKPPASKAPSQEEPKPVRRVNTFGR